MKYPQTPSSKENRASLILKALPLMDQKTIRIDEIGEIKLNRSHRAKNTSIRIKPGPEVILVSPRILTEKKARQIILDRKQWILSKLSNAMYKTRVYLPETIINSRYHRINIQKYDGENLKKVTINGCLDLLIPNSMSTDALIVQDYIKNEIRELLRTEAKAYLPQRIAFLAHQFKFTYGTITIRDSKTRWGSCSTSKNINLSLYLMRVPDHLIDYVILHELCHTVHHNHGEGFHALMNKVTQDKENVYRKELRNFTTGL